METLFKDDFFKKCMNFSFAFVAVLEKVSAPKVVESQLATDPANVTNCMKQMEFNII